VAGGKTIVKQAVSTAFLRLALVVCLGALAGGIACRDPDRNIFEVLDDADEARFRRGRAVALPCWTCHDLAGTVQKVGPSLLGVYGRRSGMARDYLASPALIGATIVWDDRSLAAFLSDPEGFVPGNRMISPAIRDSTALSDLLFYLRHVSRPGARQPNTR
jgi:cytochrome c